MSHSKARHNDVNLDSRILITVAEYDKLIERSEKLTVYEKKYSNQLKDEVKPIISEKHNDHHSDDIHDIHDQSKLTLSDQTGTGSDDLIPIVEPPSLQVEQDLPTLYNEPTSAPLATNHIIHPKSKQSSPAGDQTLLNLLPTRFKSRGEKLLIALQDFPDSITWTDGGFVTINHISVPNSNINEIFPKLFKYVAIDKVFGLSEVVTIIATLGLGSLINRQYLTGLLRPHKILNHDSLLEDTRNLKNWWYLG